MSTFILVFFWLLALKQALDFAHLCKGEYPRSQKDVPMGMDIAEIMLRTGLMVWAGYLLWWPT